MGVQEDIILLEQRLGELIIKYEQYFLGLEKREPVRLLEEVDRLSRRYATMAITNTMLKFKYNSLVAKLQSYRQYWTRINRLIEEGKYSRERFKMSIHAGEKPGPEPPSAPQQPADTEVDRVYRDYLEARRACNLPTEAVTREMVAAALDKQRPGLVNRHGSTSIEFRVVIEEGKPKIKARPKLPES